MQGMSVQLDSCWHLTRLLALLTLAFGPAFMPGKCSAHSLTACKLDCVHAVEKLLSAMQCVCER